MNSISACACADRDDRISDALGHGANELILAHEAHAHRVDERVPLVRLVEHDLAGHGRNADAVAVVADPFHDSSKEISDAGYIERAEAQRIQQCDWARTH